MTLGELIESGLVKDNHKICIRTQFGGTRKAIAAGRWFQDMVLSYLDWKIEKMSFENEYLWIVDVKAVTTRRDK